MIKKLSLRKIKLFVYDFDGIMTDNTVLVDQKGNESVRVNRGDGLAIGLFRQAGLKQIILSTEGNPVVKARARKLNLAVINDCHDKKRALMKYCRARKISLKTVLYVGNDINDLLAMKSAGLGACPADAHPKVKAIAAIITKAKGGEGVIREMADKLKITR
jgi:YrbI family 3-deoxy-D-manno-octulosonate 8-phosphate phosphatase